MSQYPSRLGPPKPSQPLWMRTWMGTGPVPSTLHDHVVDVDRAHPFPRQSRVIGDPWTERVHRWWQRRRHRTEPAADE